MALDISKLRVKFDQEMDAKIKLNLAKKAADRRINQNIFSEM